MKARTVEDLDAFARDAVKAGAVGGLSMDLHFTPKCHPEAGMKNTRAYEGDNLMLTCSVCNLFVVNIKVAKD